MTQQIAFIGLGKLGSALAKRLLQDKMPLMVYNRTKEKMKPLTDIGAQPADSIEDIMSCSKIIFTNVIDDDALIDVSDQLLSLAKQPFTQVSTSTILPNTAKVLAEKHANQGAEFFSAPILGTPEKVDLGLAKVFCSGSQAAFDVIEPYLKAITSAVNYLSEDVSHAYVMKICMNYTLMTAIELTGELYAFAEKSGLDTSLVKKELKEIYGHANVQYYIDKIHQRDYTKVNFDMTGGHKDIRIFETAFKEAGVSPDIAEVVEGKFVQAISNGKNHLDWSAIGDIIRERSGLD